MTQRILRRRIHILTFTNGVAVCMLSLHLMGRSPHRILSGMILISGLTLALSSLVTRYSRKADGSYKLAAAWLAQVLGIQPVQILFLINGLIFALGARAASGDGGVSHSLTAVPCWILGIAFTILGCRRKESVRYNEDWKQWEYLFLVVLFLISLGIRAWRADEMPFVLGGDEGSAGLTGIEFLDGSRDNLLTIGWFTFPSLYFWILSAFQSIFGTTVQAIRWTSAFAGALTVVTLYWTARALFGRRVAVWSALWLAAFHHHVFFSRLAYNNIWDGLFFTIAVGALWRGWTRGQRGFFIIAGLATGFAQFFYTTSRLIPILFLLWLIPLNRYQRGERTRIQGLVSAGLVATSAILPLGLYYLANPWTLFFTASRVSMLVPGWTAEAAAALGTTTLGLVLEQLWVTFLGLLIGEIQGVYYASGVPLLFGFSALLFLAGAGISIYRWRDPRYSILLLTIIATVVVGGLSIQAPNGQRMLLLPPVLAMIVSLPLESIYNQLVNLWPQSRRIAPVLLTVVIGICFYQNIEHLFLRYFPGESYGSPNGEVSMEMARILREEPVSEVFFVGGSRMGFQSIPSLQYLLPGAEATDLTEPTQLSPGLVDSHARSVFFILPEESEMRTLIEDQFTGGITIPRYNRHGILLFYQYTIQAE
jgi:4-amino-4-deoxy-L-arabinose transferase-like glycosyltransferase